MVLVRGGRECAGFPLVSVGVPPAEYPQHHVGGEFK